MCGITGFIDFKNNSTKEILESMTLAILHRGPDNSGVYLNKSDYETIGFGHTRLSVIDLDTSANQPMTSSCGNYVIVFNGEIYNYKELRSQLQNQGVNFKTESDTEVIIELYRLKGATFLNDIIGMFAFAIHDQKKSEVFIARDRLGVKPLYYSKNQKSFLFGSELKSLTKHPEFKKVINSHALSEYLKYGYICEPNTIYSQSSKLEKGHYLVLDLESQKVSIERYWDIKDWFRKPRISSSFAEIEETLLSHLKQSFSYRMVSDVPVGVFLSGGYDSALTCAILSKELNTNFETFTLGFEDSKFDESVQAEKIASYLGLKSNHYLCSESDAHDVVQQMPLIFDEPFADPSAIPTILLSKFTSKNVKVALSGDGGDEAFGGYQRYLNYHSRINYLKHFSGKAGKILTRLIGLPTSQKNKSLKGFFSGSLVEYMIQASEHTKSSTLNKLLIDHETNDYDYNFDGIELSDQMLVWDYERYLSNDVLVKVDRASMHYGLESREPLLDHQLLQYAATIPFKYKIVNGVLKYPLRSITHKYIDEQLINRPKKGFSPPLAQWLDGPFKEEFNELTSTSHLKNQGIFNPDTFQNIIDNLTPDYLKYRLKWSIYVFQKWHEYWLS